MGIDEKASQKIDRIDTIVSDVRLAYQRIFKREKKQEREKMILSV